MLTEHQLEQSNKVLQLLAEGEKRIILSGSAGVGKTFVSSELIKTIKKELYPYGTTYVIAPTHKALSVLMDKIPASPNIEFQTIHSALQMRRVFKGNKRVFVRRKFNPFFPPFKNASVIIADEGSMYSTELLDHLDDFMNIPIIFLGDNKQLNPVGELKSPLFSKPYPNIELTEIVRQGTGNPIIELSRNLNLIQKRVNNLKIDNEGNKIGYLYETNRGIIIDKLAEYNGTNDIKYLAWTNKEVDSMNLEVRQRIYGGKPKKIELLETLVFKNPYKSYYTNQEIKVESLEVKEMEFILPNEHSTFTNNTELTLNTSYLRDRETREIIKDNDGNPLFNYDKISFKVYVINESVFVIHEEHEEKYKRTLMKLNSDYNGGVITRYEAIPFFEEQFADLTYNHAITVHKSQGSTYGKTIINFRDLNKNRKMEEKVRLFYTGVTRASKLVVFYNM